MEKPPRQVAFKYKVIQEFQVIVYYENGLTQDTIEEREAAVREDVLDLAYNEEGLVVYTNETAPNDNGLIAVVTTLEPDIEMVYHINTLPKEIELEIRKQGIKFE